MKKDYGVCEWTLSITTLKESRPYDSQGGGLVSNVHTNDPILFSALILTISKRRDNLPLSF